MIEREFRILLVTLAVLGLPACSGDDAQDAMEDAAAEVAEAAKKVESEVVSASKSFMETARKDFEIIANEISEREATMGEALAGYWSSVESEAKKIDALIEEDWKRLATATAEEAEVIERDIAEKEREVERLLYEAKLAAIESEEEFEATVARDLASMEEQFVKLEAGAQDLGEDAMKEIRADYEAAKRGLDALDEAAAIEYEKDRIALSRSVSKLNRQMKRLVAEID